MDELIPAIEGSLQDIKRMRDRCQDAGIQVAVMAPPGKG
jgi:isochorismate hydrolase